MEVKYTSLDPYTVYAYTSLIIYDGKEQPIQGIDNVRTSADSKYSLSILLCRHSVKSENYPAGG